jgi:CBS domain-containing protein
MPAKSIARGRDELITTTPETPVADLGRIMAENAVGSVVVVENEEPVGIVTDRDLALEVVTKRLDFDTEARDVMSRDPVTANEDAGVAELSEKMKHGAIRRLPIVDADGKLSGIVTLDDMVVLLEGEMEDLTAVIKSEAPPY